MTGNWQHFTTDAQQMAEARVGKKKKNKCLKKKFIMEASLLQIKAAACGSLSKSPMPCGCKFDCDML